MGSVGGCRPLIGSMLVWAGQGHGAHGFFGLAAPALTAPFLRLKVARRLW